MDIDATFRPLAVDLIDNVFPTHVVYFRNSGTSYDPSTGDVIQKRRAVHDQGGCALPWTERRGRGR